MAISLFILPSLVLRAKELTCKFARELMHEHAEYGIASHWKYKDGRTAKEITQQDNWLRSVVEMLKQGDSAQEFLEHTKMEMFERLSLFCFTKKAVG